MSPCLFVIGKAEGDFEIISKIEIERFSLTSSKPFDQVVAALNAAIGRPDTAEFGRSTHEARSFAELKSTVEKGLSAVGLMLFMQLDHGAILRKETGRETPKMIRFVIGNPLIMKETARRLPYLEMSAPMASICHMTGRRASWPLMGIATH